MAKYDELAERIVDKVGGRENIKSLTHCMTKLRFLLKEQERADTRALKTMQGVVTALSDGEQYQVVIGYHVPEVYKAVAAAAGIADPKEKEKPETKRDFTGVTGILPAVFAPVLGVLGAAGLLKSLTVLLLFSGLLSDTGGIYRILEAAGDSLFYFLPAVLGVSAAEKFGLNKFTGLVVGAAMLYPALTGIQEGRGSFGGGPQAFPCYTYGILPVILAVWLASIIEKQMLKILPETVRLFLAPFFTLLAVIPLTLVTAGPLTAWLSDLLAMAVSHAEGFSPALAGVVVGGLWPVFIILGLHGGLLPAAAQNAETMGYGPVLLWTAAASLAQAGTVFMLYFKTGHKKMKSMTVPAFFSCLFGVPEPAVYGVTLPGKSPFVFSSIAAAAGGGLAGLFGLKGNIPGGGGILALAGFTGSGPGGPHSLWQATAVLAAAFAAGLLLTLIFYREKESAEEKKEETAQSRQAVLGSKKIKSPMAGRVMELSEVADEAFASGLLGRGKAILPSEGKVYAPANGKITTFFPGGHALGITTEQGVEVLIHVGINTAELNGRCFRSKVVQNEIVTKGKLLLEFDLEGIQREGYDAVTPIIVTNGEKFSELHSTSALMVKPGEDLIWLL